MGAATALFDLFCPKVIKKHSDYGSFGRSGENESHLIEYLEQVSKKRCDPKARRTPYDMTIVYANPVTRFQAGLQEDNGPELDEPGVFWRIYYAAETWRPPMLLLTAFLYFVGLSFVASVLLSNVLWVVRTTYG